MSDNLSGLPDDLVDLIDVVDKSFSKVQIKVESKKYGKLWATISGIDADGQTLKDLMKKIKSKMACAGTIKGKNVEILYGRHDRSKELIEILVSQGFEKDAIHVTSQR